MLKSGLRWFAHQFGYDFVKTLNYDHGRKYKGRSKNPQFDYYTTPIGNFHLPKDCKGDVVANSIKSGKIFDPHIIDVAKRYVQPGGIILDIGANYGQMSIEFSRLFPSNTIYAFEAQEMVFSLLQKNIEENCCENVK